MLPHHACCALACFFCNGHSFPLRFYLTKIDRIAHAAPVDNLFRTPLISSCAVQLWTVCAARSLVTLYLSTSYGLGFGELPGFWGSMIFHHALIPRKGSGITNNRKKLMSKTKTIHFCLKSSLFLTKNKWGASISIGLGRTLV